MLEISKAYNPKEVEDKIYEKWEKSGYFNPDNLPCQVDKKCKGIFSILMPPPNVTGTLHIGHAVMLALEDIMVRYHRMRKDKTLWLPGTDHAAIATQNVVEKKLKKEKGLRRHDLGREKFLEEVEKFIQASKDRIHLQIRKMGASCDWSREAYTLDEPRSKAVRTAFKILYDKGLIYRGSRIVNWCPHCSSTLADDEVEYKAQKAKFYTFKYSKDFPFPIATTRPETKLGDTAVAVNPNDGRYKKYIGKTYEVDFVGIPLKLKIIADKSIDPTFGTGALGVTPAHSMVDWLMAEKNNLQIVKVIDEQGRIMPGFAEYSGKTTIEAREIIIKKLRESGLIEKEEEIENNLSLCYRCGTPVEPLPSLQWFIDVDKPFKFSASKHSPLVGVKDGQEVTLKFLMEHVVKSGQIKIIPEHFTKVYFEWINNLRDWCISRQIWFGHRIPVYYCDKCKDVDISKFNVQDSKFKITIQNSKLGIVSVDELKKCPFCDGQLEQDPDTLDTWFSSGLWTFSTLGWPEKTSDFEVFHPTSVLETGYDILFFWIARMILMSTALLGEIPFRVVYLHGLVRDMQGRKMSKSLGNVIDPLDMILKYGADAVRVSLFIGTSAGTDVKLNEQKIAGYRNFANKIWNAARFVLMNLDGIPNKPKKFNASDKKIISELQTTVERITNYLDKFDFNHAGDLAYHYFWHTFCDKIIEEQKPRFKDLAERQSAQYLLFTILTTCLKILHPFMPFVTEAIWQVLPRKEESLLMAEEWPEKNIF